MGMLSDPSSISDFPGRLRIPVCFAIECGPESPLFPDVPLPNQLQKKVRPFSHHIRPSRLNSHADPRHRRRRRSTSRSQPRICASLHKSAYAKRVITNSSRSNRIATSVALVRSSSKSMQVAAGESLSPGILPIRTDVGIGAEFEVERIAALVQ